MHNIQQSIDTYKQHTVHRYSTLHLHLISKETEFDRENALHPYGTSSQTHPTSLCSLVDSAHSLFYDVHKIPKILFVG